MLRWLRVIDASIEGAARRPILSLDPEIRTSLRIGVFEATSLGVPPAVAGDAAVHLVRKLGNGRATGLVNAVMRRAPAHWYRLVSAADPAFAYSHPDWIWKRWKAAFGEEQAALAMEAAQNPAPIWVWFPDEESHAEILRRAIELVPHPWMTGAWRSQGAQLIEAIREGLVRVQDPASQLVAWLAVELGATGSRLLDLCSAPGGKTALATRSGDWSRVVASDISLSRLLRSQKPLCAATTSFDRFVQDAAYPALRGEFWDLVMLDAPCTGTGTFRRHPELRWRLHPGDVVERASLQSRLLSTAAEMVAPNGVLLYSTCSVEPEENEDLFIRLPTGFEVVELGLRLPAGTPSTETCAGGVCLLPGEDNDGFTMHAIRRVS